MACNICLKNIIVLVLFFILSLCTFIVTSRDLKQLSMLERHEKWIARHGRVYKDDIEKEHRFKTFKENVEFIESFNQNGTRHYKLAINKYADLTTEEFTASFMGLDTSLSQKESAAPTTSFKYDSVTEVPFSMDWRKRGSVTGIKNQGVCGCCWAFSAVAAIEGAYQIVNNELISLSEQQLLDCTTPNKGCNGGLMTYAYDFLLKNNGGGITTETNYPYEEAQDVCNTDQSAAVTISGYEVVPPYESALLQAVANQPISVGIAANQEFHLYGGGIYDGSCNTQLNHAVTVIGYGTSEEDGTKYWIVKNSWGSSWGEEGYMRIARDVGVDGGHCGIAKIASFPTV
ncbi:zingipain-2-like [Solanum dulcamara]|uniref:zingipain-2-like n=1 Tax=Solanum dulcamara TaxID=45834 RepID=UPI002486CAC2|nr:zingipain-2-like [Solanum dulcamara]